MGVKKTTPSLSVFSSEADLSKFSESQKVLVVLFAQKDSEEATMLEAVSKRFENVYFAISLDPSALSSYGVVEPSMIILRKFEEKRVDFPGPFTQREIQAFIDKHRLPMVIPLGDDSTEEIFKKKNAGLFLFTNSYSNYQDSMETLSKEYKGVLVMTYGDPKHPDNKKLAENIGAPKDQTSVMLFDPKTTTKYMHSGDIEYSSIKQFIEDWRNKKLEPYTKSQEIPENPYDNNVRVIVAKNFDDIVFDETKDVLVEVYAPWCGHCKKLAPEYEKFAGELKDNPDIVIGKIDGTANDIKAFGVKGFPTLKFFPANNKKKPIDFAGNRDFDGLMSFIKEKTTFKVETKEKVDL